MRRQIREGLSCLALETVLWPTVLWRPTRRWWAIPKVAAITVAIVSAIACGEIDPSPITPPPILRQPHTPMIASTLHSLLLRHLHILIIKHFLRDLHAGQKHALMQTADDRHMVLHCNALVSIQIAELLHPVRLERKTEGGVRDERFGFGDFAVQAFGDFGVEFEFRGAVGFYSVEICYHLVVEGMAGGEDERFLAELVAADFVFGEVGVFGVHGVE